MQKLCRICGVPFAVENADLEFYRKVSPQILGQVYLIPPPTQCPECRLVAKLCFVNDFTLYHRKDSQAGTNILSIYPPHTQFPVYERAYWNSEEWDPLTYGVAFDANQSFFSQFAKLHACVPRPAREIVSCENCEYCPKAWFSKDSYLTVGFEAEKCLYGLYTRKALECVDYYFLTDCQYCYQTMQSSGCYEVHYSQHASNCSQSYFLLDCSNCHECFGCVNLVGKRNCIFNEQVSAKASRDFIDLADLGSRNKIKEFSGRFEKLLSETPRRFAHLHMSEESTGDNLRGTKRCRECFEVDARGGRIEDCSWIGMAAGAVSDSYDVWGTGDGTELCYHSGPVVWAGRLMHFCLNTNHSSNLLYCDSCAHCENCFGCVGIRHKKFCILNKQYLENEYYEIVSQIIKRMECDHEWGEFLPPAVSPHTYPESTAMFFYPVSEGTAREKGYRWGIYESPPPAVKEVIMAEALPDHIRDVTDDILDKAIICEKTGRPYRLVQRELAFYRKFSIPLPQNHPTERCLSRGKKLPPWRLHERSCSRCGEMVKTAHAQSPIICDQCYLAQA